MFFSLIEIKLTSLFLIPFVYINSLPTVVENSRMIFYADDAVLIYFATTPLELKKILQRDFSFISDWYTYNRLTLHVKKTKIMFVGSKTMLLKFEDFDFSLGGGGLEIDCVSSFKYLGVILDQKWNWKLHISSLSRKLGHRLSLLDRRTRLAYFNDLVLRTWIIVDYADTIWGHQLA